MHQGSGWAHVEGHGRSGAHFPLPPLRGRGLNVTALELRIIAYGALALALMAFGGWSGYRLTANHYQALIAADREAQAATIAAQQAQATATQQAEQQYADLKASYDSLGSRLADSVRELESIHRLVLPKDASSSSEPHAAGAGPGGDPGLAEAAGRAAAACLNDAATLTALQTWAKSVSQEKVP